MRRGFASLFAGLAAFAGTVLMQVPVPAAYAAQAARPAVSDEAAAALLRTGQSLRSEKLSFKARTIRVYADAADGAPLHIFHTLSLNAVRPNRLLVESLGDDGVHRLSYDGRSLVIFSPADNKFVSIPAPTEGATIDAMLTDALSRYGVDLPLAEFFSDAPHKAFLTGATTGRVVGRTVIDGTEYLHLFFSQASGIDLELWVENNQRSLPRRLIVTYRKLPGQPDFVAEFSDWSMDVAANTDFTFQPPAGAQQVQADPVAAPVKGAK